MYGFLGHWQQTFGHTEKGVFPKLRKDSWGDPVKGQPHPHQRQEKSNKIKSQSQCAKKHSYSFCVPLVNREVQNLAWACARHWAAQSLAFGVITLGAIAPRCHLAWRPSSGRLMKKSPNSVQTMSDDCSLKRLMA
jgi:hypothetical protein